ncbi:Hypothetical predicted protein [Olea europaea subsp. europaea]|uniref:COP1-interacting protein 7 n=1 Tax=Olea europaea subsp. europaea TaxID=158383 RepID=A0A8S0R156_OLEEU|nr:Hypothetical predicted protein [Olea europaea subsp. europaea]
MKSDVHLDYAEFCLSPKRLRCELFVSSDGNTKKLASGLVKPFAAHLKVAEAQVASAAQSVKLEVGSCKNSETWFTKGTLERFVRFVNTPEILELVNKLDDEISQLEAAQRIYSQGAGDQLYDTGEASATAAADATKKELLRAFDGRIDVVMQNLSTEYARAAAAGFNVKTVSELQMFAERFGAHHLNESCGKFISLSERRSHLINPWKFRSDDWVVRSSYGSDGSIVDDLASSPPAEPLKQHDGSSGYQQQKPRPVASPLRCSFSRGSTVDAVAAIDEKEESTASDQAESIQASQSTARRLSVLDRISLFENKQKENSWSGAKPVVGKSGELRRLSSDLSLAPSTAAEKAVLRRWSGAGDINVTTNAVMSEANTATGLGLGPISENGLKDSSFDKSKDTIDSSNSNRDLDSGESDCSKDQTNGKTQSRLFIGRPKDQENSEEKFRFSPGGTGEEVIGSRDEVKSKGFLSGEDFGGQAEIRSQGENFESRSILQAPQKTVRDSGPVEGGTGSKIKEDFAALYIGIEAESMGARKEIEKKELASSKKLSVSFASRVEDSASQGMKLERQVSAPEQIKKTEALRETSSSYGNSRTPFSGKLMTQAQEGFDSFKTPPPDQNQVQWVRQSKGSQELKDLKTKATELEKLFDEHKLRGTGDQSYTSLRGKSANIRPKQVADIALSQLSDNYPSTESARSPKNKTGFIAAPLLGTVDTQNYSDDLNRDFNELSVSECSRGKFYDRYTQKRDAKLRDEWCSNRVGKEAKLKAMKDSLEQSRAEIKAKLSESADRHDSISSTRRRAERLRSFNINSSTMDQQHLEFGNSEGDENALEFLEQKRARDNMVSDATSCVDDGSRSVQEKKLLPTKSMCYSTPRHLAAPAPRATTKVSSINTGRRRMQPENALAQSVPNFSDLRKENTKPCGGTSKMIRPQERNSASSKSRSQEAQLVEEEKSRDHIC